MENGYYIFYYHDVSNNPIIPENVKTSSERFYKEIQFLNRNYRSISLDEGFSLLRENYLFKEKYFSICFDDGYLSILNNCHTFLKDLKIHHSIFLNTEALLDQKVWLDNVILFNLYKNYGEEFLEKNLLINIRNYKRNDSSLDLASFLRENSSLEMRRKLLSLKKKYLESKKIHINKSDLKSFDNNFCSFHNHSHRHLFLSNLTYTEQKDEINTAKKILKKIKAKNSFFAIPFGDDKSFNSDTLDILQKEYSGIIIKSNGFNKHIKKNGLIFIERIGMNNNKPNIKEHIQRKSKSMTYLIKYLVIDFMKKLLRKFLFKKIFKFSCLTFVNFPKF